MYFVNHIFAVADQTMLLNVSPSLVRHSTEVFSRLTSPPHPASAVSIDSRSNSVRCVRGTSVSPFERTPWGRGWIRVLLSDFSG